MATIKTCDWTKKRLGKNDETFTLIIDGKEYEVSAEALEEIKTRLEGDEAPRASAPAQAARPVVAPAVRVESNQDQPEATGEAPSPSPAPFVPPIAIPASTRERLPVPTPSQADSVIADSVRFQEGTLRALTPGRERNAAQQTLKTKWEERFEDTQRPLPDRARRGE